MNMVQLDFEAARQYALERLQRGLPPDMLYHSLAHTVDDVVPAVYRLAGLEAITGENLTLVLTAAYYHDLGYVERYGDNEPIAVRIAGEALPRCGYQALHLKVIEGIILATRLPQVPRTRLEEIMADADLDVLGRPDYFERSELLRLELCAHGQRLSEEAWQCEQVAFLRSHRYFTAAARSLRAPGQQANQERLIERVRVLDCAERGAPNDT